jgi:CRISPR-associated protein Csm2
MIHEFKKEWITANITEDCITFTEKFGRYLVDNGFTTSQIRTVFGEIKRIQMSGFKDHKTDFLLLRPKMAYASKRATDKDKRATGASEFEKVLKEAHQAVASGKDGDNTRFENFCDFVEAVLAYHKAAGGRD